MPMYRNTPIEVTQPLDLDLPTAAIPVTQPRGLERRDPISYRGERVLTTEIAAEAFGVDPGRIITNLNRHLSHFVEGRHFHRVEGGELRALKDSISQRHAVGAHARSLILWTDRGIARHAKILETDTAWAIFETLEDTYFRVKAGAAPALPNFTNPADAARAWAEQYEARILAERKKAEIGSRREATAMSTASVAVRRAKRLEVELDRSRQFATVKRMCLLYHGQRFEWRKLKDASIALGVEPIDVFDENYGTVKAYHFTAWLEAYALEIPGRDDETEEAK